MVQRWGLQIVQICLEFLISSSHVAKLHSQICKNFRFSKFSLFKLSFKLNILGKFHQKTKSFILDF